MAAEVTLDLEGWYEFKAQHLGSGQQAPVLVEDQVIQWMAELMRLPAQSSGILLASEGVANILGLAVARYAGCGFDVRKYGLYGGTRRLTVYETTEAGVWGRRGLELLGLGSDSWRDITMRDFRMDTTRLRRQIALDRISSKSAAGVGGAVQRQIGAARAQKTVAADGTGFPAVHQQARYPPAIGYGVLGIAAGIPVQRIIGVVGARPQQRVGIPEDRLPGRNAGKTCRIGIERIGLGGIGQRTRPERSGGEGTARLWALGMAVGDDNVRADFQV